MPVTDQITGVFANRIAATIGFPTEIPSSGTFVIYQGRRYRLDIRDGQYIAYDVSVFADNGTLLGSAGDVWLNALAELPAEFGEAAIDTLVELGNATKNTVGNTFTLAEYMPIILVGLAALAVYVFSKNYAKELS